MEQANLTKEYERLDKELREKNLFINQKEQELLTIRRKLRAFEARRNTKVEQELEEIFEDTIHDQSIISDDQTHSNENPDLANSFPEAIETEAKPQRKEDLELPARPLEKNKNRIKSEKELERIRTLKVRIVRLRKYGLLVIESLRARGKKDGKNYAENIQKIQESLTQLEAELAKAKQAERLYLTEKEPKIATQIKKLEAENTGKIRKIKGKITAQFASTKNPIGIRLNRNSKATRRIASYTNDKYKRKTKRNMV